jgi:uncharacterized protein YndB with AHSA1/START domain
MMTKNNSTTAEREFVMERTFNAPRELVFKTYTKCEHLTNWWGPKGWTLPVCEMDFRPGGSWLYCMRGPDGEESWGKAVYHEIVEPKRIVYADTFVDSDGNVIEGTPEMLITVAFSEEKGKTNLKMITIFPTVEALEAVINMGMEQGVTETLDRLEAYLAVAERPAQ